MPRIGTRKLHYMLETTLRHHNITIGRDKLFDLLAEQGLLVRRRKRSKVITTNSHHRFRRYPNLVRGMEVTRPNQLWVSDITYLSLDCGFGYLSLITDAYSRKIVGYKLHESLHTEGPISALEMALAHYCPTGVLTHHSDRGTQYCCDNYTDILINRGISISMTENGDPYENALAERVNGILKSEFELDRALGNFEQAGCIIDDVIRIYNEQRPHASCNYLTPQQAHGQQGPLPHRWTKRKPKNNVILDPVNLIKD
jgi:putative transposase